MLVIAGSRAVSARVVAIALTVLAAGIHAGVAGEHLALWWPYGAFFIVVAAAQATCAVLLAWRATARVALLGLWGNVAVIGVYVWSRGAANFPRPPEPGRAHAQFSRDGAQPASLESLGVLDLTALLAELTVVVLLFVQLDGRWRSGTANALFALAFVAVGLRLAGLL